MDFKLSHYRSLSPSHSARCYWISSTVHIALYLPYRPPKPPAPPRASIDGSVYLMPMSRSYEIDSYNLQTG